MTQQKNWRIARVLSGTSLVLALLSLSGCGITRETQRVVDLARRTTFIEPRFYDYVRSDKVAQREARLRAEQAWSEIAQTVPNASADYENGFTEGFADYLYRGGEGEPPLIPPRGYWNLRFLNQFGKNSTNDWYAGFRHGAQTCKSSGLRDMWTVPTSLLIGGIQEAKPPNGSESAPRRLDPPPQVTQPIPEAPRPEVILDQNLPVPQPSVQRDDGGRQPPVLDRNTDESNQGLDPSTEQTPKKVPAVSDDPFSDDPFADDLLMTPVVEPESNPPVDAEDSPQDDIFSFPDDAFESSESFQPELEETDFNSQSSRHSEGPVSIKSVQPATKISTPIALTSAEFDDDPPPAPRNWKPASDRSGTRTELPVGEQENVSRERPDDLPKGRPRMRQHRPEGASRMPLRIGDGEGVPETDIPSVPVQPAEIQSTEIQSTEIQPEAPVKFTLPSQATVDVAPRAISRSVPRLRLNQADPSSAENRSPGSLPAAPNAIYFGGEPNMLASGVLRENVASRGPRLAPTDHDAVDSAPVVMWLDDEIPPVVAAEPLPEKVRIESDDWEPYGRPPSNVSVTGFYASPPQSLRTDERIQRQTPWNPKRVNESPLRRSEPLRHREPGDESTVQWRISD